jgi:hypothetical protein
MIEERTVQELIALGRPTGRLTSEQLKRALSVESMSIDELAEVVLRLEGAGIDVDLDPALLEPNRQPATAFPSGASPVSQTSDAMLGAETAPRISYVTQPSTRVPEVQRRAGLARARLALAALAVLVAAFVLWLARWEFGPPALGAPFRS